MAAKKKQIQIRLNAIPAFAGVLVTALVAAVGIVFLDPTFASKNENAGKPKAGSCSINPSTVPAGTNIYLTGSGMPVGKVYDIFIGGPDGKITWKEYGQGTLDGNIVYTPKAPAQPGDWTYYFASHKVSGFDFKGRQVYAACSVEVTQP